MQRLFLFLLLIFSVTIVKSQNAFYDAKRLYRWSKMSNDDSVKKRDVLVIEAILNKYDKLSVSIDSLPQMKKLKDDITTIGVYSQSDDDILKQLFDNGVRQEIVNKSQSKDSVQRKPFKLMMQLIDSVIYYDKELESFSIYTRSVSSGYRSVYSTKNPIDTIAGIDWLIKEVKRKDDSTGNKFKFNNVYQQIDSLLKLKDTIGIAAVFSNSNDLFISYFLVLSKLKKSLNDNIRIHKNQLLEIFNQIKVDDRKDLVGAKYDAAQQKASQELYNFVKNEIANVVNMSKADEAETYVKASISDQNFPTQSEIIDALAIYISKRFKQELTLTFVENLAKYFKDNVLAVELFPATFNMLNNADPYVIPKVGAEWRNAISNDLIHLPENIVNNSVVKKWVNDSSTIDHLNDGVIFGKYVSRKFSFVDIIRSLYLQNGVSENADIIKGAYTKKAVLISYMINEEFYDTVRTKYWISADELFKLEAGELVILHELLSAKYNAKFVELFKLNPLLAARSEVEKLRNKYSDLIIMFKEFENSQVASYLARKEGGNLKDAFWDFQRIFLEFMMKEAKTKESKSKIKNIQNIFFVYDYITNKNFGAAINSGLEILDSLLLKRSPTHYLRAFLKEDVIVKFDRLTLKKEIDSFFVSEFSKLEVLARVQRLAVMKKSDRIITIDSFKREYKLMFADTLYRFIPDATILNLLKADDESLKVLYGLMDSVKAKLTSIAAKNEDLKKLVEKIQFSKIKSIETFTNYMMLAENLIFNKSPKVVSSIRQVSGFLTDASTAKDSKELSKVINAYAMPPLSYKLTRTSRLSLNLNAYLGFWSGLELGLNEQIDIDKFDYKQLKAAAGFTVPLGVSLSWGQKIRGSKAVNRRFKKSKIDSRFYYLNRKSKPVLLNGFSHTVFVSVIDIAGPVAFRFKDSIAGGLPQNTRWAQVLAPGIHYSFGLRDLPVCFTAGFQISPQLRTYDKIENKAFSTARFQLGVTYDMPLLTLYRRKN